MNARQTSITMAYVVIGVAVVGRGQLPARVLNWARSQPLPVQGSGSTTAASAPAGGGGGGNLTP